MSRWDDFGGDEVMADLIAEFYARIDLSSIRHLFPADLSETVKKQFAFQSTFWGGPDRYTPWRGHPRLRMQHLPFPIGPPQAETWIGCMSAAIDNSRMPLDQRADFLQRMRLIAHAMVNLPQPS